MSLRVMAIAAIAAVMAAAPRPPALPPLPPPPVQEVPPANHLPPDAPTAASAPPGPEGPVDIPSLICSLPWPCHEALQVATCESRLDPAALGDHGERGIFQVIPDLWGPVPADATGQVLQAFHIWQEHGWAPWSCRPTPHDTGR